ncbi:MAG TPA: twin-arginine translocation signal domain-containing protein, partial [Planctomycetaceae bacterium]|nr:twin-arginine translocation signal domain-containing protein [Planctomycetaceae bacterium]
MPRRYAKWAHRCARVRLPVSNSNTRGKTRSTRTMETKISRRRFMTVAAATGVACGLTTRTPAAPWKTTLYKALIGKPDRKTITQFKEAGFEGLETRDWDVSPDQAASGRKIAESLGMKIHSVMRGWARFNHKDKA